MMSLEGKPQQSGIAQGLFLISGLILILYSLLYNEFLLGLLDKNPPLSVVTLEKIRVTQSIFFSLGVIFVCLSRWLPRLSWFNNSADKGLLTNVILLFLSLFLPFFILELSLKPMFYNRKTTIFIEDDELGWKLRPNTEDLWGTIKIKVNGKGLRGPELSYAKPDNVARVLYLGDSVTIGYGLESHTQTFPYIIETILRERLGRNIETINAGVDGYSPWQEYIYLSKEGIKYSPNLVVVGFVLNDVTEKFGLIRFGGSTKGSQLALTASSRLDAFLGKSALVYYARQVVRKVRFGGNVQKGATREEMLNVGSLVYWPDRPEVKKAWEITEGNLQRIFEFCKARDIEVVLVVFPFRFQFHDPDALAAPQIRINRYARDKQVPVVDLLPLLAERAEGQMLKPEEYFLDYDHLSPLGSRAVAEIIAEFLQEKGLVNGILAGTERNP